MAVGRLVGLGLVWSACFVGDGEGSIEKAGNKGCLRAHVATVHVVGIFDWQSFAGPDGRDVIRRVREHDLPLSAQLGVLGLNGITALLGLTLIGEPKPGDTVLEVIRVEVIRVTGVIRMRGRQELRR